jgi:putative acetyltransferase
MTTIIDATREEHIASAAMLFREYEAWLGLNLCFQGFEAELAELPGKYAPPDGRLLLAYSDEKLAGCAALRKLNIDVCEMKRLFVRDAFRGRMIGISLIDHLIAAAREIGYSKLRLDTFPPKMGKAVALYKSRGFIEIPAYYENPYDGVLYMELSL